MANVHELLEGLTDLRQGALLETRLSIRHNSVGPYSGDAEGNSQTTDSYYWDILVYRVTDGARAS